MTWQPSLGAWPDRGGTCFRVWAPETRAVEIVVEHASGREVRPLDQLDEGCFGAWFGDIRAGTLYRYRLDGRGPYPDPASRFQPAGVHGPSQVIDPAAFTWSDLDWTGRPLVGLVLYELHVGCFSEEGTFAGAAGKLRDLAALGVSAIELMPVADFPGARNWGYDGVDLFAPARCYGAPDDLRRLVDTAHALGLAVVLDVVYNHLGPDGAYLSAFSPYYFTERHQSPWGAGVNLDDEHSAMVRAFFIENALHWLHEYHVDGLRLDATHTLAGGGATRFPGELSRAVRESLTDRRVLLIAEDNRNLAHIVKPVESGGWGFDAVWADDFHHQARRLLAGDAEGYYADYRGRTEDLAVTIRRSFFYTGQYSSHVGGPRGTDPGGIPPERFVFCLQNHDQVGNRAFGDRLHHSLDLAAYRAATLLLLVVPETPLLFMGQEWAASSPFLYFTDHHPELGRLVTEGRRREFRQFEAFSDPCARTKIPDPQAESAFMASRLDWREREGEPHSSTLRLYRALIALRRSRPSLQAAGGLLDVAAPDEHTILVYRQADADAVLAVVRLCGTGCVRLDSFSGAADDSGRPRYRLPRGSWEVVLSTEDPPFTVDPSPPEIDVSSVVPSVTFARPSAVLFATAIPPHKEDHSG